MKTLGFRFAVGLAALTLSLLLPSSSHAVIVHHCDYGEHSETVHAGHDGTQQDDFENCGNVSDNLFENPFDGECEHSSAFYWTFMECSTTNGRQTCQITGTIDCPASQGGDKSYQFTCAGPVSNGGANAGAAKDHAACSSEEDVDYCGCESPGHYCANGGGN